MPLDILVAGATGRFGAAVKLLLERGHGVRALTREPESTAARALEALGAQIVPGDYDDPAQSGNSRAQR
jgi:uncharacterized protein YbjT (DUF2867 family)